MPFGNETFLLGRSPARTTLREIAEEALLLHLGVEETMAVLGGRAKAHAKKKSFRSAPRIVSDNDRCTLLIRLVSAICFSLQDAGASGAGKPKTGSSLPRWPFRRRKGRGKHTLRAAFTEGQGEPGHDNGSSLRSDKRPHSALDSAGGKVPLGKRQKPAK
jgi:hypothetical protein